jgi:hypothetical protein
LIQRSTGQSTSNVLLTGVFHVKLPFWIGLPAVDACGLRGHHRAMTKYLISFPSAAMVVSSEDLPTVSADSRAVIAEAKAAGVYVFAGGIDEGVNPTLVSATGSESAEAYPDSDLRGGFCVLEIPTREEAVGWAAKIAAACRCSQELREFGYDPDS